MDQLDAFHYFLINLGWHNLVLVAVAVLLGLVLGRLVWGKAKVGMDQLRERLKAEEGRTEELRDEYEAFREQVEAGGDGPVVQRPPGRDEALEALQREGKEKERHMRKAAEDLERLSDRVDGLEAEKERLLVDLQLTREDKERAELQGRETMETLALREKETESLQLALKKAKGRSKEPAKPALPPRRGSAVDLAKAEAAMDSLETRLEETTRERNQVEEASAVLRKELYGMRRELETVDFKVEAANELEASLKSSERRVGRLEGMVARETRSRKALEEKLKSLEGNDRQEGGRVGDAGGAAEAARGAAADLRGGMEEPGTDDESAPGTAPEAMPEGDGQDDLKRIKGIGGVLEQKLKARGVRTLRQMAAWTDEDLAEISEALNLGGRAERGDWRGQARALREGE